MHRGDVLMAAPVSKRAPASPRRLPASPPGEKKPPAAKKHPGETKAPAAKKPLAETKPAETKPAEKNAPAEPARPSKGPSSKATKGIEQIKVRRVHRRDLNRVWEFLKITFRDVNKDTVEYQRPRTKARFMEIYDDEGVAQLVFETSKTNEIVGYAECAFEVAGADNWINARYFEKRDMRPMFVDELAVHPRYQGRGVGSFVLDQLEHLARVRGCTHLVLEVAKNNTKALRFYRKRNFFELDAAIFLAMKVPVDAELLPPRPLRSKPQG